jgi:hypothetical protein
MKSVILTVAAMAAFAPALASQNPPTDRPPATESLPMRRPMMGPRPGFQGDPERMQALRRQIEERWGRVVQQELALSDQQMERVRAATRAHQDRRRDLGRRRADLERGIQGQMQPGVAANQDSLDRMLEAMARLRVQDAESDEQLNRDLGFLTPVQRARYFMMARRFEERLRAIRQRQLEQRPGAQMRPGVEGRQQPARPLEDELDN